MKFSKNSWHYKLVNRVYTERYFYTIRYDFNENDPDPRNWIRRTQRNVSLCKYFWSVVLGCVLMALWTPINYLLVKPIEFVIRKYSLSLPDYEWHISPESERKVGYIVLITVISLAGIGIVYGLIYQFLGTIITLLLIGGIIVVSFAVYGLGKFIGYLIDHWPDKIKEKRIKEPKKPNIVMEAMKARKSKVCPLLDFTDD
jgi:hypothetical protein